MIYDCIPFFNEVDILIIRLHELKHVVDHHVLVEADKTFSGRSKLMYFDLYKHEFKEFQNKILHVVVDDMPQVQKGQFQWPGRKVACENRWSLDMHQKDCVKQALRSCKDDDIIIISDVDEIPRAEVVKRLINRIKNGDEAVYRLILKDYRRSINQPPTSFNWPHGPILAPYKLVKNYSFSEIRWSHCVETMNQVYGFNLRKYPRNIIRIENAGWHLSDMIGNWEKMLQYKRQSFAHSELEKGETLSGMIDYVKEHREYGKKKFRHHSDLDKLRLADDLPEYLVKNLESFSHFCVKANMAEKAKLFIKTLIRKVLVRSGSIRYRLGLYRWWKREKTVSGKLINPIMRLLAFKSLLRSFIPHPFYELLSKSLKTIKRKKENRALMINEWNAISCLIHDDTIKRNWQDGIDKKVPFGFGFHGNKYYVSLVDYFLKRAYAFVETGTWAGLTTYFVGKNYSNVLVYSCDVDKDAIRIAQKHCSKYSNINIVNIASPHFLYWLFEKYPLLKKEFNVYWLDAHWFGYLPLKDEIAFLTKHIEKGVIIIDDFRIPGKSDFEYSSYGGNDISFDLIKQIIAKNKNYKIIYPNFSREEAEPDLMRCVKDCTGDTINVASLRGVCAIVVAFDGFSLPSFLSNKFKVNSFTPKI